MTPREFAFMNALDQAVQTNRRLRTAQAPPRQGRLLTASETASVALTAMQAGVPDPPTLDDILAKQRALGLRAGWRTDLIKLNQ